MNYQKISHLNKYLENLMCFQDEARINLICDEIEKEFGLNVVNQIAIQTIKNPDNALVIVAKDVSGSMGIFENETSKEYFEYAVKEIDKKYNNVELESIKFHTAAEQINVYDLFKTHASGGTIISCSLTLAKEIIDKNLDKNIYLFLLTDGDNLTSDNKKVLSHIEEALEIVNHFQVVEINAYNRHSSLYSGSNGLKNFQHKKFSYKILKEKDDALKGIRFKYILEAE